MAKAKSNRKQQDLATPMSILLFKDDAKELAKLARETGVLKSNLVRMAVRSGGIL